VLWYTLPWSFEKFFQLAFNRCNNEREIYASPSSSTNINILPLPALFLPPTRVLQYNNQSSYHCIDTPFRLTIPTDRIIQIDCLDRLNNYFYTTNLRSLHILLRFSSLFPIINWNSLRTLPLLPLVKSLRITICNFETLLEDEHCQAIVERVPMLTDFLFCFRRYQRSPNDNNDPFNIHRKSISNLYDHISTLLFDQHPKIIIEPDGCGLIMWL
jgi:hypothetical protein